jgi:transcriptional regulator with XRE-family HTH domain
MRIASEPQPALGKALRHFRTEKAGISQEVLEQRTGVHRTWISKIELGHNNPAWGTVMRLIEGLGVSLSELASLVEQKELE